MKSLSILFTLLACMTLTCRAADQDIAALQGKWKAIEATSNGEPPPQGMLEKITLVFTNDTVSIMGAPFIHFKVDTSSKPAHIDFLNSSRQAGIYVLEGDTLKLCSGQDGDRPTAFETKKYTDHTYLLLKHVKE